MTPDKCTAVHRCCARRGDVHPHRCAPKSKADAALQTQLACSLAARMSSALHAVVGGQQRDEHQRHSNAEHAIAAVQPRTLDLLTRRPRDRSMKKQEITEVEGSGSSGSSLASRVGRVPLLTRNVV